MAKKNVKNTAPEKTKQKPVVIRTSWECENCKHQCLQGEKYVELVNKVGKGKGVVCRG